jgi:hypothetical protein
MLDDMLDHGSMRTIFALLVLGQVLWHGAAARAQHADSGQSIYRYVNKTGRVVYTNIVEAVPVAQRERAKMDLSRITLNTEVGSEIERHLQEEHAALTKSPYCTQLREAANVGFLEQLWEDFAPLIACGGMLLALLLFTPAALRRFGAPEWAKVLMMAIPSLALGGLVMFSMSYTNNTIVQLKARARPCAAETFAKLSSSQNALFEHVQLVDQLKQQMAKIDQESR